MESLTTAISVQIDSHDKEVASSILKKLGLNMSTYVNMAIKYSLQGTTQGRYLTGGVPPVRFSM